MHRVAYPILVRSHHPNASIIAHSIVRCCSASKSRTFSVIQARLFSSPPSDDSSSRVAATTAITHSTPTKTTNTANATNLNAVSSSLPSSLQSSTDVNTDDNKHDDNAVADFAQRGKSLLNTFFHQSSKRSQRQKKRRLAVQRRRRKSTAAAAADEEEWVDNRTVRQILFPRPHDFVLPPRGTPDNPKQERKPLKLYFQAAGKAWTVYRRTWRGFWASGIIVEDPPDEADATATATDEKSAPNTKLNDKTDNKQSNDEEQLLSPNEVKRRLRRNVRRNAKFVRKTALQLRDQVRQQTGIESAEDARRIATDTMLLVSNCLQEFLTGYRDGRDGQVRKMLEEDLRQQQRDQTKAQAGENDKEGLSKKKRRRRIRRRVLRRLVY